MAIHVDVIPILKDRDVQREADNLANDMDRAGQISGDRWGSGFSVGIQRASPKIQKALNTVENATVRVTQAQREYDKISSGMGPQTEAAAKASERLAIARRNEGDAHRSAAAALREHIAAARETDTAMENINNSLQRLGMQAFRTGRGLATIAGPAIVGALWETARVAVTASQSLAALPAVAAAAAAGIGTLQIATAGFNQAMKDIGDLDKFNADLVNLGPNAAQAALEIRNNFLPVFDQIQRAAEDKLFAGVGQRLEQLKTAFAPGIQGLTSSIAQSFNQMALGASGTLLSPANMASLSATMDNISASFRNAAPAAGMFTQAFTDIINVGSQFLPELGSSITDIAAEFSAFITRVSSSGELHAFIADGIESAKALGGAVVDIGKFVYETFGGVSQGEIQAWTKQIKDGLTTLSVLVWPINEAFKIMNTNILNTGKSLSDLVNPLTSVVNSIKDLATNADDAKQNATDKLNEARARVGQPPVDTSGNVIPGGRPVPAAPAYTGSHLGFDPYPTSPGGLPILGAPSPFGAGGAGKPPKPPKPSDKERRDAIIAGLNPSEYRVADPFAPLPGLPDPYAAPPGAVQGTVDPQAVFEAQQQVLTQAHDLEEDRKNRLALERDNQASAEDINDAKWKEVQDATALQKAQANLADKQRGTAQSLKSSTEALSAGLDPDLGLSKGLSGFVDNMVRFAGHMAMAPEMARMQAAIDASPIKGGYGLLGIQGAQNISQGLSPLLGQPMPGDTGTGTAAAPPLGGAVGNIATGGGVSIPTTGLPDAQGAGPQVAQVEAIAQQFGLTLTSGKRNEPGSFHNTGEAGDFSNGSGNTPQELAFAKYMADNFGPQLQELIYSDPSFNQLIGGGKNVTGTGYYSAGTLADHTNHVHVALKDMLQGVAGGVTATDPTAIGYGGATAGLGGGGGVVPVYVTNMGGGGMGLGGGLPGLGGGVPGQGPGIVSNGMPSASASPGTAGKDAMASTIINQARAAGLSREQTLAALAVANQESAMGSNPAAYRAQTQNGTPGITGPFQQDNSYAKYGNRNDPAVAAKGFIDQFIHTGQGLNNPDPFAQALAVQRPAPAGAGGYDASTLRSGQYATALDYYNRLAGGGGPGIVSNGAGTSSSPPLAPGGGQGPILPQYQPGMGTGSGAVPPTQYGGVEPPSNAGGGGMGITPGGTIDSAIQMAASAFPGVGQAAATGMKLANRAIQYGGQMAGIGVEGLMQTFLPTGGSELASNSWLTRLVGGLAGASPALPNMAGKQTKDAQQQAPGPLMPQQVTSGGAGPGLGGALGAPITVNYANNGATEDRAGADIAHHLGQMNQPNAIAGHR